MKVVVILGSARKETQTERIVNELIINSGWDLINLNDYSFSYFDYDHSNKDDDFLPLIRRIIANYDVIIFATPVYWFAMSGIMKVFFDRITDLLVFEKETGRKLRGKGMAAISCSVGNNLGEHFWLPFRETAAYLGMLWFGSLHTLADNDEKEKISEFIENIKQEYRQLK